MALTLRYCCRRVLTSTLRNYSAEVKYAFTQKNPSSIQSFRTEVNNPCEHNESHLNRFYMIPQSVRRIYKYGGLPKRFREQVNTFMEAGIMVREPAVEIISYLQCTDYSRPINKFVLYGVIGAGKSVTLAHILHYGFVTKKVLVHVPWVPDWFRRTLEVAPATQEGFYDLSVNGSQWLRHFLHQNTDLLSQLDLKLSKDYVWNAREQNLAGSPVVELVKFGIVRAKYACAIVDILLNELKLASTMGKCNTLVVIDGFNAFFGDDTDIHGTDFKKVLPDKITLTHSFLNFTKPDWCNGALILTVDQFAVHPKIDPASVFPRYLLGKEGFEHLDPFLPVEVKNYSSDEFDSAMEYYKDRKWVRTMTDEGHRELELLTNMNPYKLMRYTAPL